MGCRGPGQFWRAGQGQRQGRKPQGQPQPWPVCVGGRTPAERRPHKLSNRRATASSAECVRSANFKGTVNPRPAGPQTRRHVRAAALSLSVRHSRSRRVLTNDKPQRTSEPLVTHSYQQTRTAPYTDAAKAAEQHRLPRERGPGLSGERPCSRQQQQPTVWQQKDPAACGTRGDGPQTPASPRMLTKPNCFGAEFARTPR